MRITDKRETFVRESSERRRRDFHRRQVITRITSDTDKGLTEAGEIVENARWNKIYKYSKSNIPGNIILKELSED